MFLSRHSKVYQEELIKELQIDKSAVTRLLQNMENKGLIKRIQSPVDKRFIYWR
ncbi:MAG: MarR family transcriptional regulator [Thomasclavelia ramosa]